MAILISNKAEFRLRRFIRDEKGHYIMIGQLFKKTQQLLMGIHLMMESQIFWAKTILSGIDLTEAVKYSILVVIHTTSAHSLLDKLATWL